MNDLKAESLPILPRGIIFDCDGVVTDSWKWSNHFYNTIRQRLGLPPMTAEEKDWVFSATIPVALQYLFSDLHFEDAVREARTFTLEDALPFIKAIPGVEEFLKYISRKGTMAAVNTNGGRENGMVLESLNLARYFTSIVTSDDVDLAKPDPAGAEQIIKTWGLSKDQTVYIGDSHVDQETARSAGLKFWAFRNPDLEADLHFEDFSHLTGRLRQS